MYYSTIYLSPVGLITLACDDENLIGLWLVGQKYHSSTITENVIHNDDMPVFDAAKKWLDRYFNGDKPAVSEIPISPRGSEFRRTVWSVLCEVPYGEVVTYGDIAKRIALKTGKDSSSARAVGGAVGHNPISIIIPCHRVVGANGSLTGYAGGIGIKKQLLELEARSSQKDF